MRILVVGLGSIGRRHVANLAQLLPNAEIAVWRHSSPSEGQGAGTPAGVGRVVYTQEAALDFRPTAAVLSSPAPYHIAAASALAAAGVHLLIEKPISHSALGVPELLAECRRRALVLMVGYNLRFNESLRWAQRAIAEGRIGKVRCVRAEVGSYLPDWRPGSDYRQVVSAQAALGGGAVLELSHEIDYVRWLGGEVVDVSARLAQLGGLGLDVEDSAEITLGFSHGGIGQVHVDMIQRATTRQCRVIGTEGTVVWDGVANTAQLYESGQGAWTSLAGGNGQPVDRNAMYLAELQHFLDCIHHGREPEITGEDAWRVLQIALASKRSELERKTISL